MTLSEEALLAQRNTDSKLIPEMKTENKRRKKTASPGSSSYLGKSCKPEKGKQN